MARYMAGAIVFSIILQNYIILSKISDSSISASERLIPRHIASTPGCFHNGTTYGNGSLVPTIEPCLNCKCMNNILICALRVCPEQPIPPPRGCVLVQKKSSCCSYLTCTKLHSVYKGQDRRVIAYDRNWYDENVRHRIFSENSLLRRIGDTDEDHLSSSGDVRPNGQMCIHNGTVYRSGSAMSTSSLCSYCYCFNGQQKCIKPKCLLPAEGCHPVLSDSSCCPIRYDCSGNAFGMNELHSANQQQRRSGNKHYLRMTSRTQRSRGCIVNSTFYPEGERLPTDKSKPCDICFCIRGNQKCMPKKCAPTIRNCRPIIPQGECCPESYDCDYTKPVTAARGLSTARQYDFFSLLFGEDTTENNTNAAHRINTPPQRPAPQKHTNPSNSSGTQPSGDVGFLDVLRDGLSFIDNNGDRFEKFLNNTNSTAPIANNKTVDDEGDFSLLDLLLGDDKLFSSPAEEAKLIPTTETAHPKITNSPMQIRPVLSESTKNESIKFALLPMSLYNMVTDEGNIVFESHNVTSDEVFTKLNTTMSKRNSTSGQSDPSMVFETDVTTYVPTIDTTFEPYRNTAIDEDIQDTTVTIDEPTSTTVNEDADSEVTTIKESEDSAPLEYLETTTFDIRNEEETTSNLIENIVKLTTEDDFTTVTFDGLDLTTIPYTTKATASTTKIAPTTKQVTNKPNKIASSAIKDTTTATQYVKIELPLPKVTSTTTEKAKTVPTNRIRPPPPPRNITTITNSVPENKESIQGIVNANHGSVFSAFIDGFSSALKEANLTEISDKLEIKDGVIAHTEATYKKVKLTTSSPPKTSIEYIEVPTIRPSRKPSPASSTVALPSSTSLPATKKSPLSTLKPQRTSSVAPISAKESTNKPLVIDSNPSILDVDVNYDYDEPTLPPSLPNLKIIPFLPTDAVKVVSKTDQNKLKYDYYPRPIQASADSKPPVYIDVDKYPVYSVDSINDRVDYDVYKPGMDTREPTLQADYTAFSGNPNKGTQNSAPVINVNVNSKIDYELFDHTAYPPITKNPLSIDKNSVDKYPFDSNYDYDTYNPPTPAVKPRPNFDLKLNYIAGNNRFTSEQTYHHDGSYSVPDFKKFATIYPDKPELRVEPEHKTEASAHLNHFSPPIKTEGGFVPQQPGGIKNDYFYENNHQTNSPPHVSGLSTEKPTKLNINQTTHKLDNPFTNVIRTESPPNLHSIIGDKEHLIKIQNNMPHVNHTTLPQPSDFEKYIISITTDGNYNTTSEYADAFVGFDIDSPSPSNRPVHHINHEKGYVEYISVPSNSTNHDDNSTSPIVRKPVEGSVKEEDYFSSFFGFLFKDEESAHREHQATKTTTNSNATDLRKENEVPLQLLNILNVTKEKRENSTKAELPQRKNNKIINPAEENVFDDKVSIAPTTTTIAPAQLSTNIPAASEILRDVLLATLNGGVPVASISATSPNVSPHAGVPFISSELPLNPAVNIESKSKFQFNPIRSELDLILSNLDKADGNNFNSDNYQLLPADSVASNTESYVINPVDLNKLKQHQSEGPATIITKPVNNVQDPAGILKLAGCNIYGRMYRVGRIISELSNPCLECKCTEVGVHCTPLEC